MLTHKHFLQVVLISAPGSRLNEISAQVWKCCKCVKPTEDRQTGRQTMKQKHQSRNHKQIFVWIRLLHPNHHPALSISWERLWKRGLWLSGIGQDTSLQLHKPGYPAGLLLPTRHVLEFHFGNCLSVLDLSLAKVENSFPSLMDRNSHFQSEADERERSGVPLGEKKVLHCGTQRTVVLARHPQ